MIKSFNFYEFRDSLYENREKSFLENLKEFLERESIYGFEQDINNILMGTPSREILNDLEKSFYNKEGIDVRKSDVIQMNRKSMLERFLNIKGINGYTEAILDMWGQYRKEGKEKVIKVKDKEIYHLKPSEDTVRLWCWNNSGLKGIPTLISVKDLYDVIEFGKSNPADYRYIKE